jgi:ankyrin repeat protein
MEMLLEARALVCQPNDKGYTALHFAAQLDRLDCLRLLLAHKHDMCAYVRACVFDTGQECPMKNSSGKLPYQFASPQVQQLFPPHTDHQM